MELSNRKILYNKDLPRKIRHTPKYQNVLRFADWLDATGGSWITPDFEAFVRYLFQLRQDAEWVEQHIDAIRERYSELPSDRSHEILAVAASQTDDLNTMIERVASINDNIYRNSMVEIDTEMLAGATENAI